MCREPLLLHLGVIHLLKGAMGLCQAHGSKGLGLSGL